MFAFASAGAILTSTGLVFGAAPRGTTAPPSATSASPSDFGRLFFQLAHNYLRAQAEGLPVTLFLHAARNMPPKGCHSPESRYIIQYRTLRDENPRPNRGAATRDIVPIGRVALRGRRAARRPKARSPTVGAARRAISPSWARARADYGAVRCLCIASASSPEACLNRET